MKGGRILFALVVGALLTGLQLVAVGALNEAHMPVLPPTISAKKIVPLVVHQPPPTAVVKARKQTTTRTAATKAMTPSKRAKTSALNTVRSTYSGIGLGTALPTIGNVGLGQMDMPEPSTEPDRPARVHRAITPVYPLSAQRNQIEGYVLVRLSIDVQGRVRDVIVVDAEPMGVFEKSARDAARRFTFVPARINGVFAPASIEKKIVFRLK